MVRVLFFGRLREIAGAAEVEAPTHLNTVEQVRAHLGQGNPALGAALTAGGVRTVVDRTVVSGDVSIGAAAEVAFLPPLSGG